MSLRRSLFAVALAATLTGCFSHYSDGPKFRPVEAAQVPEGHGLVYLYRPPRGVGAGWFFPIHYQSRRFTLVSGSYGVFVVPEGKKVFQGTALLFGDNIPGAGGEVEVQVKHDAPSFVRITFDSRDSPLKAQVVSSEEGLREISSLHLGAGGGARTPIAAQPPPELATPPAK